MVVSQRRCGLHLLRKLLQTFGSIVHMLNELDILLVNLFDRLVVQPTMCEELLGFDRYTAVLLEDILGDRQSRKLTISMDNLRQNIDPFVVPSQDVAKDRELLEDFNFFLECTLHLSYRDIGEIVYALPFKITCGIVIVVQKQFLEHLAKELRSGDIQINEVS